MSLPRALLVGISAVALLTVAAPVDAAGPAAPDAHAAAAAKGRSDTSIRFLSFDHLRAYGTSTTIRGQVAATVGGRQIAVRNVRVRLYRKLKGTSRWHYLGTRRTTTSQFPQFRFRTRSIGNAHYRVRFAGTGKYQPSRGATSVRVHRVITGRIENGTGRFHGRVTPRYANRVIHLQKRACGRCRWHGVRTERTGNRASYAFKVRAPRRGQWYWRVSTPAQPRFIRSYSGVFTTRLR